MTGGRVIVVCPLTVGGGFEAKTEAVGGQVSLGSDQPGSLKGALTVDLRTLKTGIGLRDRHMRDNYLEVAKAPGFDTATIEGIQIEKLDGKTTFNGTLVLHGERRPVSGLATHRAPGRRLHRRGGVSRQGVGVQHPEALVPGRRSPGPGPHQDRADGVVNCDDRPRSAVSRLIQWTKGEV